MSIACWSDYTKVFKNMLALFIEIDIIEVVAKKGSTFEKQQIKVIIF